MRYLFYGSLTTSAGGIYLDDVKNETCLKVVPAIGLSIMWDVRNLAVFWTDGWHVAVHRKKRIFEDVPRGTGMYGEKHVETLLSVEPDF